MWDESRFNDPLQPVVGVSWYEAEAYCNWLKEVTAREYRLPTEEEWEKAARGKNGKVYPWGNKFNQKRANTSESELGATTPVLMYPDGESDYGAFDLSGNAWEWTSSKYSEGEPYYVLRGGSYIFDRWSACCADRNGYDPFLWEWYIGFRVVASPF